MISFIADHACQWFRPCIPVCFLDRGVLAIRVQSLHCGLAGFLQLGAIVAILIIDRHASALQLQRLDSRCPEKCGLPP